MNIVEKQKKEKQIIGEEIDRAKNGKHQCEDPDCLISEVVPIALNIKTKEAMSALIDLIHFCYSQLELLSEGGDLVSVGRVNMTDISVDEFKEMVDILGEGLTGHDDISDVKKNWVLLAKEAGQDQESIVALFQIFYFIRAIFYTWIAVKSRKKLGKAVHN